VTVEVQPANKRKEISASQWLNTLSPEKRSQVISDGTGSISEHPEYLKYITDLDSPPRIVQIKGKQNRAPNEQYLPFVQDFVRSGQWSDVGDLKNTGLEKFGSRYLTNQEAESHYKPLVADALNFLETHPSLERHRVAQKARNEFSGDPLSPEYRQLERSAGEPISKDVPYTYNELRALLSSPEDWMDRGETIYRPISTAIEQIEKAKKQLGILPPAEGMKAGGAVGCNCNDEPKMQAGGAAKTLRNLLKPRRTEEPSLPLDLPRAPAKTREEIRPAAQRMAEQMTGEFVRPNPKKSINPAKKSRVQFEMERGLTHDIRPTPGGILLPQQVADIEKQKGMLKIGVSGDTTIADKSLYRAGPYQLDMPSPQHGGPLYALGGEGAWASNNPVAATFQKRVQELSQAHGEAPVLGQFLAMGPQGSNFALHFADANLRAIDPSKMSKQQVEMFNNLIREGSEKSGPRPSFPGIEDKDSAYLHFAFDAELRKHFNAMMQKPDYTNKLGLPDGRVILHAITEPELRNTEVLTSGLSQMRLDPSVNPADLALSVHPTYSHVIPKVPGSDISRTKYPMAAEIEFPDVAQFVRQNYKPKEFTRVYQTATPRQIVDQQHIDEIKMYEELMKQYTGKKKGGKIGPLSAVEKV
jgi:hypothetical protein